MNRIVYTLVLVPLLISLGCTHPNENKAKGTAVSYDHFRGWYALPARKHSQNHEVIKGRDIFIPIFKIGPNYYTACRGVEVPLKPNNGSLEWALEPSSMVGTQFGFEPANQTYFIIIVDRQEENFNQFSMSGQRQPLFKTSRPETLSSPQPAPAPQSLDDFLGIYRPVWFPYVYWEINKDADAYQCIYHELNRPPQKESSELIPLPDRLGFVFSKKGALVYNASLKRFELEFTHNPALKMPLMRLPALPATESQSIETLIPIGIPSWH